MATNFNEDTIHVVKVGSSAQNEVREYFHELDTDLQGTDVYYDFIWGPQPTEVEHQRMVRGFSVVYCDTEEEEMPVDHDYLDADEIRRHEEEMLKDIDHINYGLGCHESDCERCDARSRVIQLEIDHSHGDRHGMSAGCISCLEDEHFDADLMDYID